MTCAHLNAHLFTRSAAYHGLEKRRLGSVISLLRVVLKLRGLYGPDLPKAAGLAPVWGSLYLALTAERRKGLIAFIGYCTFHGITPDKVTLETLRHFEAWTMSSTLHRDPDGRAKRSASNWNWAGEHVAGWPDVRLVWPSMKDEYTLPLEAYPPSMQADIGDFLSGLACHNIRSIFPDEVTQPGYRSGRSRRKPLSKRTIQTRRYHIRQALAALVRTGVVPDSLRRLADFFQPIERVKTILEFHIERRMSRRRAEEGGGLGGDDDDTDQGDQADDFSEEDHQSTNLAGIGETLRQIAKYHCKLPEKDVALISGWAAAVKPPQQTTMTEKNALRLRDLLAPQTYAELLHHPEKLMLWADPAQRKRLKLPPMKPRPRALLALYAVALEILIICPMRRENLAGLRLNRGLLRTGDKKLISHLVVRGEEVKNGTAINWPIPPESARLIENYLREHRPLLAEEGNPYLFPGSEMRGRGAHDLAVGLCGLVEEDIGAKINLHLLRHMAVVRFLTIHPGQYELVRRLLGHRSVRTTIDFYSGPEMDAAIELFASIIRNDRRDLRLQAGLHHPSMFRSSPHA